MKMLSTLNHEMGTKSTILISKVMNILSFSSRFNRWLKVVY